MRLSASHLLRQLGRLLRVHRRALVILLVGIGAPLYAFGHLAEDVWKGEPFPWDRPILERVHSVASPAADAWMLWLSGAGYVLAAILVPIAATGFLLVRRRLRDAFFLATAVLGASGLVLALKVALRRVRPDLWISLAPEESYSFPSGHAMTSLTVATALVLVARSPRSSGLLLVFSIPYALSIGFSRVYLGVHFPSDILAGWTAAIAWTIALWAIVTRTPPARADADPSQTDGLQ